MQSVDKEVIQAIVEWLNSGKQCWLATVIETGALRQAQRILTSLQQRIKIDGFLSGGCVEEDLLKKLVNGELATNEAQFFQYGVTNEEAEKLVYLVAVISTLSNLTNPQKRPFNILSK